MSPVKVTKAWTRTGTTGFDALKFNEQTPLPELGDHDVLVEIHAASLNYRDLSMAKVSWTAFPFSITRFWRES